MIHPLSDVQSQNIGEGTRIWQFSIILAGARVGKSCNINCHTFIENDVTIGDFVTIKAGVYLWDGIEIDDHVFIGPNVTFTNDKRPRSGMYPERFQRTKVGHHASIGASATILGGIRIGEYAMIGAGSLVTKDVPPRGLVVGHPAKVVGWLQENGNPMTRIAPNVFSDDLGRKWAVKNEQLTLI